MPTRASSSSPAARPVLGAHVSSAGHIDIAADHAKALRAEAVQVFGAAPQQWRRKQHPESDVAAFRSRMRDAGVGPNFIHGIYLVNLATADAEHLRRGIESLTADMRLAGGLGVAGVIFHVGSHKGLGFGAVLPQVARAIREVLAESPPDVWLCLENNAGAGDSIGSRFAELGAIPRRRRRRPRPRLLRHLPRVRRRLRPDGPGRARRRPGRVRPRGRRRRARRRARQRLEDAARFRPRPSREPGLGQHRSRRLPQPARPRRLPRRHLAAGGTRLQGRRPRSAQPARPQGPPRRRSPCPASPASPRPSRKPPRRRCRPGSGSR